MHLYGVASKYPITCPRESASSASFKFWLVSRDRLIFNENQKHHNNARESGSLTMVIKHAGDRDIESENLGMDWPNERRADAKHDPEEVRFC